MIFSIRLEKDGISTANGDNIKGERVKTEAIRIIISLFNLKITYVFLTFCCYRLTYKYGLI